MATPIKFETLWSNYPTTDPCIDPKTGNPPKGWENQCAIRLGLALDKSGVSFNSFHGSHCPVSTNKALAASAQQLANWLELLATIGRAGCETQRRSHRSLERIAHV